MRPSRKLCAHGLVLLALGCRAPASLPDAAPPPAPASAPERPASALEPVAGTRVSLAPPAGFFRAAAFAGYEDPASGCALLVLELPGPLPGDPLAGLAALALGEEGFVLLDREPRGMGAHAGTLLHLRLTAGGAELERWLWAFGSESESALVAGTCRAELSERWSQALRDAVLSSVWEPGRAPQPRAGLGFRLGPLGDLKPCGRLGGMALFSAEDADGQPALLAGRTLGPAQPRQRETFARTRMLEVESLSDVVIEESRPITLDGLEGLAIVARGRGADDGVDYVLDQVMLFDGRTCWLIAGSAAAAERETFLPLFQRAAEGFRRDVAGEP
jgi:hypothetical protein